MQPRSVSSASVKDDPGLGPGLVTGKTALESQPAGVPSTASPSTQFVAVQGGQETTSAELLLVTAYILMWVLLLGFVYLSFRRQRALEARVGQLERALAKAEPEGQKAE